MIELVQAQMLVLNQVSPGPGCRRWCSAGLQPGKALAVVAGDRAGAGADAGAGAQPGASPGPGRWCSPGKALAMVAGDRAGAGADAGAGANQGKPRPWALVLNQASPRM